MAVLPIIRYYDIQIRIGIGAKRPPALRELRYRQAGSTLSEQGYRSRKVHAEGDLDPGGAFRGADW
jgi:hypothetical protein